MQIATLRERCTYWQDRLNLREWEIAVRWGKADAMTECVGFCLWSSEEQAAYITLARTQEDHEGTLIHELLHIVLQGHADYSGKYDIHTERAINKIAAALQIQ